ncbi:MAG: hypothetical protein ABI379_10640 [Rhodanobacter sp.]
MLARMLHPSLFRNDRLIDFGAMQVQQVPNGEQIAKLQASILRYLADHPHAADTVRGIARYWTDAVPTAKPPALDAVRRALDALVSQERIACAKLGDGTRVYESLGSNQPDDTIRDECPGPKG